MNFADFPFLSANIVKENGEPFFTLYIIEDFGKLKVAIVGFTTEETTILEPLYLEGLKFGNALKVAQEIAPKLKEQADVVIALAHLDWGDPKKEDITTTHQLAKVDGIDVVVAGHSHVLGSEVVDGKMVVSAGEYGKYVGRLDLDVENGKIVAWHWQAIPVNLKVYKNGKYEYVGKPYLENRYVSKEFEYFKKVGNEKLDTVIGETKNLLDGEREHVRSKSTNLTNLVADAMRWKVKADIALTNGIRASIKPGKITVRDILTVLPFGNTLYVLNLTGEQIMKVLEYAATVPEGKGAFLQVSGLTWKSKDGRVVEVLVNGEPLDLNKTYKVVTNNYMAGGGDGYTMLKECGGYDTGFLMSDAVIEYIQNVLNGVVEEYDASQRCLRE